LDEEILKELFHLQTEIVVSAFGSQINILGLFPSSMCTFAFTCIMSFNLHRYICLVNYIEWKKGILVALCRIEELRNQAQDLEHKGKSPE
jgi:hypothetical protein